LLSAPLPEFVKKCFKKAKILCFQSVHKLPASSIFRPKKYRTLPVTVKSSRFLPAEPVAYERIEEVMMLWKRPQDL
jgi:hypothetical protein